MDELEASLETHYAEHPGCRPTIAEVALALAAQDRSPLAAQPDVIATAAEAVLALRPDADADDVLTWAESIDDVAPSGDHGDVGDHSTFRVVLGEIATEFMSRAEAKRLAIGLEAHERAELDFTGVAFVGQGFDELFRVWATAHPHTELVALNAIDDVAFMIQRGLPR